MKIIDAHKVQMKLFEECQNIRYFDKDRKKSQIFADGIDFAWVMLDNAPTVKAIPIEWIEHYVKNNFCFADWYGGFIGGINMMLEDWEKENEKDSE